jgi:hypothetical protein
MPRRLALLVAIIAAFALSACNTAPAAPALSDPKEILLQSVASLQNVKTVQVRGTFGGTVTAEGMGNFDLSTVTLNAAVDVEGKKTQLTVDAPTLLGTNVDLIVLPDNIYFKLVGPLAAFAGLDATGKYTQMPVDAGMIPDDATDPTKAIEEFRTQLAELPTSPEKLADERCGDTDCYHVRIAFSEQDLQELAGDASEQVGSASFDIWSRKNDLRPARMGFAVDAGPQGHVTGNFDLVYDQSVNISAPPADQVAPAP